ncbi:MAG: hypothetical protein PHX52_00785 [Candidatus Pacebacteria bacterium]|nr:hypothetical protein [Candidatus Paceibacterota bacterium]MDD3919101.1 hypothetical protein [Candidatus Paceibacterota bacterium]
MEKDITYLTDLILSNQVQSLIAPYRDISILISILFFVIGFVMLFQERFFFAEIRRRIFDFCSDAKKFTKPKKFVREWKKIEKLFQEEDYENMVVLIDKLMLQILISFGYVGSDSCGIIAFNSIGDSSFPNVDNVKKVCELRKAGNISLKKEEATQIFNLSKETLLKINILER